MGVGEGALYVAESGRVLRFDGIEARLDDPPAPVLVAQLPAYSHHGWRYIGFGPDERLYVSMGAPCNVCEPEELLPVAREHAELLASRPISSLVAVKRTIIEPLRAGIDAARARENAAFAELMGGPANTEALTAFAEGREADFTTLPPGW